MVTAANFFNVLKPQMVRNALDLVVDNLQIFHLYDGFDLQTTFLQEFGKTLLFFGVLVLVLALIQGIFMYFMRQTIIVMSRLIEYDMRKEIFQHYENLRPQLSRWRTLSSSGTASTLPGILWKARQKRLACSMTALP